MRKLLGNNIEKLLSFSSCDFSPPLFIVGAPRSGTTLAYQILTEALLVSFFNNAANRNSDFPLLMSAVGPLLTRNIQPDYTSNYGSILGRGQPSQGDKIWSKFLGEDRSYHPINCISDVDADILQKFIAKLTFLRGRPFINKSISNSVKIHSLNKAFPDSHFIWIKRDPFFNIQSNYYNWKRMPSLDWVSSKPSIYPFIDNKKMSTLEKSALQVLAINLDIEESLSTIERNRYTEISYESFCEDPYLLTTRATELWPGSINNEAYPTNLTFTPSKKISISKSREMLIRKIITMYEGLNITGMHELLDTARYDNNVQ